MKSKISFYNKAVFLQYLKLNVVLGLMALALYLYNGPFSYFINIDAIEMDENAVAAKLQSFSGAINGAYSPIVLMFFALGAALISCSYLFDKRTSYMIHAMPITRKEMFFTSYCVGLMGVVLPVFISGMTFVVIGQGVKEGVSIAFKALGVELALAFLEYNLAVLMCHISGFVLVPIGLFLIFNYLYRYVKTCITTILGYTVFGFEADDYSFYYFSGDKLGVDYLLSPPSYFGNTMIVNCDEYAKKITFAVDSAVCWYVPAAIVFLILAWLAYRYRPIEAVGDLLTFRWVKIFFAMGISACVTLVAMTFIMSSTIYQKVNGASAHGARSLALCFVIALIAYVLVSMGIHKTIHFGKKRSALIPAVAVGILATVGLACMQYDVFDLEHYTPDDKDIVAVHVRTYADEDTSVVDVDKIKEAKELQQFILSHKDEIENIGEDERSIYVNIVYDKANGMKTSRSYEIPYDPEKLEDKDSLLYRLDAQYNRLERYLGEVYKDNQPLDATVYYTLSRKGEDVPEDSFYNTLDQSIDSEKMYDAFLKDLEAGAIRMDYPGYNWASSKPKDFCKLYNVYITLTFKGSEALDCTGTCSSFSTSIYSIWNAKTTEETVSFYVNDHCKNVIALLEEEGFKMDEMMTAEEYLTYEY